MLPSSLFYFAVGYVENSYGGQAMLVHSPSSDFCLPAFF